ncbi:hypothetical protein LCGC14_2300750 [marine sediment metagenome]|uniref:Uncharacterized protein n=1 Tax=marine sediment metagenome TaxID=412755 RepID=A0A0F9CP18_9ZZZZ
MSRNPFYQAVKKALKEISRNGVYYDDREAAGAALKELRKLNSSLFESNFRHPLPEPEEK